MAVTDEAIEKLKAMIVSGELGLGTWQGIFLWEHRRRHRSDGPREVLVHIGA